MSKKMSNILQIIELCAGEQMKTEGEIRRCINSFSHSFSCHDSVALSVGWVSGIPLTIIPLTFPSALHPPFSILHPRFVCGLPRHLRNPRFMILSAMILPSAAPLPIYHFAFCIYHFRSAPLLCVPSPPVQKPWSLLPPVQISSSFCILHSAFCISRKGP